MKNELEEILDLLKQDSCACGDCVYRGMKIDVSCRKSNGARDYYGGVIRITGDNERVMKRIGNKLVKNLKETWWCEFNLVLEEKC